MAVAFTARGHAQPNAFLPEVAMPGTPRPHQARSLCTPSSDAQWGQRSHTAGSSQGHAAMNAWTQLWDGGVAESSMPLWGHDTTRATPPPGKPKARLRSSLSGVWLESGCLVVTSAVQRSAHRPSLLANQARRGDLEVPPLPEVKAHNYKRPRETGRGPTQQGLEPHSEMNPRAI